MQARMFTDLLVGLEPASPILLLLTGALVGLLHAFEPDHIVAVTTQIPERTARPGIRRGALRGCLLGGLWGLGHTQTILLVSILVLILSQNIPDQVFDGFEFVVGVMLVLLGASVLTNRRISGLVHSHPHRHDDGLVHSHPHRHNGDHRHGHKSYLIGCIHGLAGSGALIAISAPLLSEAPMILLFYAVFGLGSVLGMIAASGVVSIPFSLARDTKRMQRVTRLAAGTAGMSLGAIVILELML